MWEGQLPEGPLTMRSRGAGKGGLGPWRRNTGTTCDLQRAPGLSREAENGGYGEEKRVKKHPGQSPASHCGLGEAGIYNSRRTFSMH